MARKYISIRIESRQPNGTWAVRNAFTNENADVQCGEKIRTWLLALASAAMIKWGNYDRIEMLRVTGRGEKDG